LCAPVLATRSMEVAMKPLVLCQAAHNVRDDFIDIESVGVLSDNDPLLGGTTREPQHVRRPNSGRQ
jgi:hypothetical protein